MQRLRAHPLLMLVLLAFLAAGTARAGDTHTAHENAGQYRQWIVEMKSAERGPFSFSSYSSSSSSFSFF